MRILNLGSRVVNTYLLELKQGYLLIDTGYKEAFTNFIRKLSKHGIALAEIKYILLTHAHDDHAGFLNELLSCTDAKVILHEDAAAGLRRGQNCFDGGCTSKLALWFCKLMELFGKGEHRFPPVNAIFEERYIVLNDESRLLLNQELSGQIIDTPGHTSCSISLLMENGLLFCGDAAMNGFPSTDRTTIWAENIDQFCASWEVITSLHPTKIYPSHGKPFPVSDLERYLPKVKGKTLLPFK